MEMVESFTPDVVVLDYGLPGKNGLQIYRDLVRHTDRPVGCVMISGFPLEDLAEPANMLGIRHLLGKPFSLSDLQQMVELSAAEASGLTH
jgi:CheY-like chemotaxis protein